jgi:hypothetical protein
LTWIWKKKEKIIRKEKSFSLLISAILCLAWSERFTTTTTTNA